MENDFAVIKCEAQRMSFDYSERVFDGVRVCVLVCMFQQFPLKIASTRNWMWSHWTDFSGNDDGEAKWKVFIIITAEKKRFLSDKNMNCHCMHTEFS